ncbi:hypothetical protein C8F01DRAFT_1235710, partial [Mycena amicta]
MKTLPDAIPALCALYSPPLLRVLTQLQLSAAHGYPAEVTENCPASRSSESGAMSAERQKLTRQIDPTPNSAYMEPCAFASSTLTPPLSFLSLSSSPPTSPARLPALLSLPPHASDATTCKLKPNECSHQAHFRVKSFKLQPLCKLHLFRELSSLLRKHRKIHSPN